MPAETDVSREVLEALALPKFAGLDEARAAGRACVWGGEPLRIETAVDLGEQVGPVGTWFPRASRRAVAERAHRALVAHAPLCPKCRDEGRTDCALGAELHRLVLVYTPVRYCASCARQIGPGEEFERHLTQAPSGTGGATLYTHRACPPRRSR
ncbi:MULTISPECIES: hypothetical protein [Streptomyces]|uniref:Uncharacterized protein n=1 Tax=Streptomyces doudnae TaxID=3075536 RepID=A0ABD5ELY7_9ACTN|nr:MULTISPECIES: hypothetical protein [unclassified Streptomyces]MDT0435591.1 hypothetical protein [Streptomyces sp. DSM 41981]SCD39740.1 hypothetical protein GA0115242_104850 [Streptomyces sp. SolWspMP-5a-2]